MAFIDQSVYDFLAAQAADAQAQAEDLSRTSGFTITGTSSGQIAVFSGTAYTAGVLVGDSNGVSVGVVTAPAFGLQISLAQNLKPTGSPTFAALTLTAPLSVANGGTNATTAGAARTSLGAAKAETPGAHTITLAKITGGGTDGSITWNADGVIVSYVDPT